MRILFLLCALFAASARNAYAIKLATQTEIDAIEAQFLIARGMDEKIDLAKAKHEAASSSIETSRADLRALERDVEREEAKQRAARTKAIHMTILAYGLTPAHPSGRSVMRWTKDRMITWLPVAGEGEDRLVQSAKGRLGTSKKPVENFDGVTYPDGVTYIPESAFKRGPGFLASVLLHERTHFEQYTTDGKGNVMSRSERQEEAYQAQVDNAEYFFDPVKDKDVINEIKRFLRDEKKYVESEKGLMGAIRRLLPADNRPDKVESAVHTNSELADISGLVAKARAQAEMARREREERSRAAAEKTAKREHDERLKRTLGDLALRSCANPGSVTQAELDGLPRPYDEDFYHGKLPNGLEGTDGTGYCTEPYIYMGEVAGNGIDAEKLRSLSSPTAPANTLVPPPPQAIRAIPVTPPIRAVASIPFSSVLPGLKNLAVTACRSSGQVPVEKRLTEPYYRYSFSQDRDDRAADDLAADLGSCDDRLFRRMIELIRAGQGANINSQWVRDRAAEYSRMQNPPSFDYSPPTGCIPGDNSRRNCIACGNSHCG